MKKVYWRPRRVSTTVLTLIASLSLSVVGVVEIFKRETLQPHYKEKIEAAQLAEEMFAALKTERLRRGIPLTPKADPSQSGLIGSAVSDVTSVPGNLIAKQTSANPNFAAVIVEMLFDAGVKPGDLVAVGYSGSFPAINAALCAALEVMKAKPVVISSATASQWGANLNGFLWIDMEDFLFRSGLMSFKSIAASLGGLDDIGQGMELDAQEGLEKSITNLGLHLLRANDVDAAVEERVTLYKTSSEGRPYKAYINVGGGTVSVGGVQGKKVYTPGLNIRATNNALRVNSIMSHFMREGVPVLHLVNVVSLARSYSLPVAPPIMPNIGEGSIFSRQEYNKPLAAMGIVIIIASLIGFLRSGFGVRLIQSRIKDSEPAKSEPMV